MKNLFDSEVTNEVAGRINKLTPGTKALWGKMTVAQMLTHVQSPLEVALGEKKLKGGLLAFLFGRIGKKQLVKDEPFKKNLPTAPGFIVKDERNFDKEKNTLLDLLRRFSKSDPGEIASRPHPFFGKLTADEWNLLQMKHLDHHLRQFGV